MVIIGKGSFEWDQQKEELNKEKHGIDFSTAIYVFKDPYSLYFFDERHSQFEARYFCIGKVESQIITVRFRVHRGKVRIYGAGLWRKWRKIYEKSRKEKEN